MYHPPLSPPLSPSLSPGYPNATHASPNFAWRELAVSAQFPELVERVPDTLRPRLAQLAHVLEALRAAWGNGPVRILSGYRGERLNEAVGGSATSQHRRGEAVDVRPLERDLRTCWQILRHRIANGDDAIAPLGQCVVYPGRGFLHLALAGARYPRPTTCVHAPPAFRYAILPPAADDTWADAWRVALRADAPK